MLCSPSSLREKTGPKPFQQWSNLYSMILRESVPEMTVSVCFSSTFSVGTVPSSTYHLYTILKSHHYTILVRVFTSITFISSALGCSVVPTYFHRCSKYCIPVYPLPQVNIAIMHLPRSIPWAMHIRLRNRSTNHIRSFYFC